MSRLCSTDSLSDSCSFAWVAAAVLPRNRGDSIRGTTRNADPDRIGVLHFSKQSAPCRDQCTTTIVRVTTWLSSPTRVLNVYEPERSSLVLSSIRLIPAGSDWRRIVCTTRPRASTISIRTSDVSTSDTVRVAEPIVGFGIGSETLNDAL